MDREVRQLMLGSVATVQHIPCGKPGPHRGDRRWTGLSSQGSSDDALMKPAEHANAPRSASVTAASSRRRSRVFLLVATSFMACSGTAVHHEVPPKAKAGDVEAGDVGDGSATADDTAAPAMRSTIPAPVAPPCSDMPAPLPKESLPKLAYIRQPLSDAEGIRRIVDLSAGAMSTCAVDCEGKGYCWGLRNELDVDDPEFEAEPPRRYFEEDRLQRLDVGSGHPCGLTREGALRCSISDFGRGAEHYEESRKALAALPSFRSLTMRTNNRCAFADDGVYCWGENWRNSLGLGSRSSQRPTKLVASVVQVSLDHSHSCGVTAQGDVLCWGSNVFHELGCQKGSPSCLHGKDLVGADHPRVEGLPKAQAVAVGGDHSCALTVDGQVYCWGSNDAGEAGGSPRAEPWRPTKVEGLPAISDLDVGFQHGCGLTDSGEVYCWGSNILGQIGLAGADTYPTPRKLSGLPPIASITLGEVHTCALTRSGHVLCWGVAIDPSD